MALVELRDVTVPADAACAALGVSRASLYRARRPSPTPAPAAPRAPNPRRLGDAERQHLLDMFHTPEFADQPPTEVYAALLGRGIIRTMYRLLAAAGESKERRNQRLPHVHVKPSLKATAPNQVWTWDITKLATEQKGVFLLVYVIIDLFSRYVVGWMVATKECKHLAAQLFAETIARHGVEPGLTVHADRGSAMKSDTLAQLLASLGASHREASAARMSPTTTPTASRSSRRSSTSPTTQVASRACSTVAGGLPASSAGTTTSITTPASRSSPRPMSSSAASRRCARSASSRSMPPTFKAEVVAGTRDLVPGGYQVGTKSALSQYQVQVLELADVPRALAELMVPSGRTDRTKFRDQVVAPLLDAGVLEMTIPDKPRSSKQQYRITEAGRALLRGGS